MAPKSRRSVTKGGFNHGLRDDEIEELEHQPPKNLHNEVPQQQNKEQGKARGVRGPTMLKSMWVTVPGEKTIKIDMNAKGQPIGPNKKTFVEFLGTIARTPKFTPLEVKDWRKVSEVRKKEIIGIVKAKYDIPPGGEHWILRSLGKKRRSWKNRVKTQCFDPTLTTKDNAPKRPARVGEDQWKHLLPYWAEEKTKVQSMLLIIGFELVFIFLVIW
ncbi:OLC1v1031249C1 [Oldenlandia corymbosa var. corymbosa]|uniref:OLC1v1031249C1 n=1 Tax=Oldenlandia corymbosa var. corymbosa TaxID=529605 RepID=A0AAV1CI32_OLDCO|nr:OLC1v1031249C1 [Oldenlandia corymbosa var. corymbosa]